MPLAPGGVNVLTGNPAKIDDFAAAARSGAKRFQRDFAGMERLKFQRTRFNGGFAAMNESA